MYLQSDYILFYYLCQISSHTQTKAESPKALCFLSFYNIVPNHYNKVTYIAMGIIINRKSHDCICNRDRVGGDEGNRTPVRKNLAKGFSERSWCFKSPSVHRPSTGYALWQLLSCDRVRSAPLFTFTSNRRPLHSRGTLCRNEQHSGC